MSTRSGSGNGGHGGTPPPGGRGPTDLDLRTGHLTGRVDVDTDGLHRGARRFEAMGGNFRSFGQSFSDVASHEPLVDGEGDESWERFAPDYHRGARAFLDGVLGLARAVDLIADGVHGFADFCVATEDRAEQLGRNALRPTPDP
ncbi:MULTISPECIES: hypothetical protein [Saccharothrix]|uniref:WXG100 family type VII secretion target n=2 Tax=Saccharothrix TaxID=2071 RepID=A0ABU0X7I0_9PSEU|nr:MULTISPECIES: hypothetical protein [Saccharothrix]MDQ2588080.1 hypothetical protein [Saccharothrix yanglingensis]MDR6593495.1 hypothetical protein [Saccharothrix longispora]